MENLVRSTDTLDFWVWVDPRRPAMRRQLEREQCLGSGAAERFGARGVTLPVRDGIGDDATPLAIGALKPCAVEQMLEALRQAAFSGYPSRLNAIRLFRSESGAAAYRAHHVLQTANQRLKRVSTRGPYVYSAHDWRWLQAMRRSDGSARLLHCACRYWLGAHGGASFGNTAHAQASWTRMEEVLYLGTVIPCDG